jgi:ribonucleoside-triphosphate reductase
VQAFDEAAYLLMCGTGVGFSVERQYVNELPDLPTELHHSDTTIKVSDSRIGWATAIRQLFSLLYSGVVPKWDVTLVRPKGARLKTFGGRASGPEPLVDFFKFLVATFRQAVDQGQRKLNSLQCHSLMTKVGDIVVSGGVRRSALISLSNPSDDRMRNAKSGNWWETNPHFTLANNSAAWTEKPEAEIFLEEWLSLVRSKSGERGIFNRAAATAAAAKSGRRKVLDKDQAPIEFGCNPCAEIILRDRQFCNLSEVVVRSTDTRLDLLRKVELATILGTLQSTFTSFRYLSSKWKENTEEERLLGVSLTGVMDHEVLSGKAGAELLARFLEEMRETAVKTNADYAKALGVNPSTAITCVKPSGTVSQLVDAASGIHPRYSPHYIRTNRANAQDPVAQLMKASGIPCEDDITRPGNGWVFSFPQKAPEGSVFRKDLTAIQHLELWLLYQDHWCEHKPSITVQVKDHEWLEVGAFVYKHFDKMSGVAFLPYADHVYRQAPYQECTAEEYDRLTSQFPTIDWGRLPEFEKHDTTTSAREFACSGNSCELTEI